MKLEDTMKSIKAAIAVVTYLCFMSMTSAAEITGRVSFLYVDNSGYTLAQVTSATGYLYCYKPGGPMELTSIILSDASSDQRNNVWMGCSDTYLIGAVRRAD